MTEYREILRLSSMGLSRTSIGASLQCSRNTVADVINRAMLKGVVYPLPLDVSDNDLQQMLYPERGNTPVRKVPNCEYIHKEMAKSGVTLSSYGTNVAVSVKTMVEYHLDTHNTVTIIVNLQQPLRQQCTFSVNQVSS